MPVTNPPKSEQDNPNEIIAHDDSKPEVDLGQQQGGDSNLDVGSYPEQPTYQQREKTVHGLSPDELKDTNSISVTISDKEAPLVILFGPPACGKTMTMVRMTRFLKQEGYTVSPIRTFRPSADANYNDICNNFDQIINSNNAVTSTSRISFMLVEVMKNGSRICQILEAPGEHYFDPKQPNSPFPNYVNTIISMPNRKIWTIMIEPNWFDAPDRANYVNRITKLKQSMRREDAVVFVYNKIDKTHFVFGIGHVNKSAAIKDVEYQYPSIFVPFKNQNPITSFWKKYNCDFVPFQTGYYTEAVNGLTFQEGPREYCAELWNTIKSKISGR